LLNAFSFADVSAPGSAGPETKIYALATNPTGILVRNFFAWNATFQGELRTLQTPQVGYTPLSPVGLTGNVGLGQHPGIPQVVGLSFYVTCWVYDITAPPQINPVGVNIVDMTNVIRIQL
jgi:hypothetical protein